MGRARKLRPGRDGVMRGTGQVHAEGGRYLGRAMRNNVSLVSLNLRLNRLTDEGGRMLMDGLQDNLTLTTLNLRLVRLLGFETRFRAVTSVRARDCVLTLPSRWPSLSCV